MNHTNSGVEAFSLRVVDVSGDQPRRPGPYVLAIAVAESNTETEVAHGTRSEMKTLRHQLLIAIRNDRGPLEALSSSLAAIVRGLRSGSPTAV